MSCFQPGSIEWSKLCTRLAALLCMLVESGPTQFTITINGAALGKMKEALEAAVLQGVLLENCNLINAKAIASEKKIVCSVNVTEVKP